MVELHTAVQARHRCAAAAIVLRELGLLDDVTTPVTIERHHFACSQKFLPTHKTLAWRCASTCHMTGPSSSRLRKWERPPCSVRARMICMISELHAVVDTHTASVIETDACDIPWNSCRKRGPVACAYPGIGAVQLRNSSVRDCSKACTATPQRPAGASNDELAVGARGVGNWGMYAWPKRVIPAADARLTLVWKRIGGSKPET